MRSKPKATLFIALCALVLLSMGSSLAACGTPWDSTSANADETAAINQATYALQAALGLPDGAITRSSQQPLLGGSDVAVRWLHGRADVDGQTGRIRAVLVDDPSISYGSPLSDAKLDDEADRIVSLLGWDSAALETQGFTPASTKTVDYGDAGVAYQKTWEGHDAEGVPNEGVIEIGLNAKTGNLHSFLYNPGPEKALDMTQLISQEEAVKDAKQAVVKAATARAGGSSTTQSSTATTAKPKSGAGATTTTNPLAIRSAALVHSDRPAITGGKDLLVWVVKVGGDGSGKGATTVYLDATSGKVLVMMSS